jgi:hypothetical protein
LKILLQKRAARPANGPLRRKNKKQAVFSPTNNLHSTIAIKILLYNKSLSSLSEAPRLL